MSERRLTEPGARAVRPRGPQRAPKKVPVSIRLSPEVLAHFKAGGRGWQGRIDDALKQFIGDAE